MRCMLRSEAWHWLRCTAFLAPIPCGTRSAVEVSLRYYDTSQDQMYMQFIGQYPLLKIGRASFCALKPTFVRPLTVHARETCLCKTCTIMRLFADGGGCIPQ